MVRHVNRQYSGPPLTPEAIEEFEREIGGRLPDDYKQFMLAQNGGFAEPMLNLIWRGEEDTLPSFIKLTPSESTHGLRQSLEHLRELNPDSTDGFLPIADTFSEQYICLAIRGNVGAVFHTVYTYETLDNGDRIPIDVRLEPLADSFSEFLDSLTEVPPEPYCPIEDLGTRGTPEDLDEFLAGGNSIDAIGRRGLTMICVAVKADNLPMLRTCIERGASLSGTIQSAVDCQRTHLVGMLVEAGADVNERDQWDKTPLDWVGGTALPGEDGERNRELEAVLKKFGATRTVEIPMPPPGLHEE